MRILDTTILDTTGHISHDMAASLAAEGVGVVLKYCRTSTQFPDKAFTAAEVEALHSVEIKIGHIWETTNQSGQLTAVAGASHAALALKHLRSLSAAQGAAIFFAVDYDCGHSELADQVEKYFVAVRKVLNQSGYRVGVYGSGLVCSVLKAAGLAHYTFLAQSTGWAGYEMWKPQADIVQGPSAKLLGMDVDTGEAANLEWAW